jgi:hypothetical protein
MINEAGNAPLELPLLYGVVGHQIVCCSLYITPYTKT